MQVIGILVVIQLSSLVSGLNNSNDPIIDEIDSMLKGAEFKHDYAYKIVDRIYNDFGRWLFTIIFCEFTYLENSILQYMETYDYGYPVMLLDGCPTRNGSRVRPKFRRHGVPAYVMTSPELSLESNDYFISALTRTGVWKPRSKVIFVLTRSVVTDGYFNYAMKSHFRSLWSSKITNTILIVWNKKMKIYTYNHFVDSVIDITHESDLNKVVDDQYRDFYGYELKLSVYKKNYIPDAKHPITCDSKLIRTIMEHFNSTCRVFFPRDNLAVGDLFENGTATGVTADLIDGYTDMELGSRILKSSYFGYIDTTYPLSNDDLCFMTLKRGRYSTFMSALVLISGKMFAIFVGNLFLFITIALIGILTTALTYPRLKPDINTLEELSKTNLILGIHSHHIRIFKDSLSSTLLKKFEHRIEIIEDEDFERVIDTRDARYALLMRHSDIDYIKKRQRNISNGVPIFHAIQECPVPCFVVSGLNYGSPHLPKLDKTLQLLSQGGIFKFWHQSLEYDLYTEGNKVLFLGENKVTKPLDLAVLQSVFYLWFGGIVVSTIVFIIEMSCHLNFLHLYVPCAGD
ncbi:hypothetical protein EVAR_21824_1 [Eumeta japonica]|uniref:Uncharacterized protein n=1 Tax=Eumeta variegata TaxID=151549 RepID=A0A4C1V876_EUMVA|nr:hypothetical protein EVAR_21824_1 [Eumeta japonica]